MSKSLSAPHQIKQAIAKLACSFIQVNISKLKKQCIFLIYKKSTTTCRKSYENLIIKKLKMTSEETSLNNTFSEFTLKYFCLISMRSDQESKICSNQSKTKWVICEWPMCKRERAVSFRLVKQRDGRRSVNFGNTYCVICFWDIHHIHVARAHRYSYSYSYVVWGQKRGWIHPRYRHQGHP